MIDDLKPYPRYKDSGVETLGHVPDGWKVTRVKRVARLNPSKSEAAFMLAEDPRLTFLPMERVSADGRVDAEERRLMSELWGGFTYFRRSDVIVAKITPCFENGKGACLDGLPTEVGFGSTEFHVLRPNVTVLPKFLYRLSTTPDFRRLGAEAMIGAAGQQRVPQSFIGDFQIGLPPLSEQSAIVRFLAHVDKSIRKYIRAKREFIRLLNEQKQAIIHQAVTRGLNSDARLKPSSVEWLGVVPEHWKVSRFKFEASHIVDCLHATPEYADDGEFPAIRTADIEPGRLRIATARKVRRQQYDLWTNRLEPQADDILYSREGERFGIAALVPAGIPLCISQRMMVFRIRPPQVSEYIMWQLNCRHVFAQAAGDVIGATAPHVNVERIKNYWIVLPPPEEQQAIVEYISSATLELDAAIDRTEREIALLREYRTRLIADVVTGKLDVRAAAAALPDEPAEPDDIEPPEDDTETEGEAEPDAEPEEA